MSPHFLTDPGTVVNASTLKLVHEPVLVGQLAGGTPSTATAALGECHGLELGVWEMSPGAMTDVEVDEVFIVLSGTATVQIEPFDGAPSRTLVPVAGEIVQLREGMRTLWTVTETFRKIYLA